MHITTVPNQTSLATLACPIARRVNDELSEKELGTNSSNLLKSPGMSPEDKMRLLLVLCMAQRDKKDVARLPEG